MGTKFGGDTYGIGEVGTCSNAGKLEAPDDSLIGEMESRRRIVKREET